MIKGLGEMVGVNLTYFESVCLGERLVTI